MTEISPLRFVLECLVAPRRGGWLERLMIRVGLWPAGSARPHGGFLRPV
ncbi:hypothetical protein KM176_00585 [Pseudooceanicola sp. CBS1P-1]|uniref:Uncharacterized protein n=1 Tax=Pseudooceanicola albus TaxID=2692189 RepID=A0A6L7FXR6_9RHOB|nr:MULTISPECIES: hypothetical protein [Pseudooceanicola]MBT9382342.1 hypothetical protein [Pseudooceanicola endophyticus]MXN16884.1 hypothetical protein [Pseudooceanicola albus]